MTPNFSILCSTVAAISLGMAPLAHASLGGTQSANQLTIVELTYEYQLLAQVGGDEIGGGDNGGGRNENNNSGGRDERDGNEDRAATTAVFASVSEPTTDLIIRLLREGETLCGATPIIFRPDCIAENLRKAARELPSRGDYAEARTALNTAVNKIDDVVRKNQDRAQPRVRSRATLSGRTVQTPPLVAVKPETVPQVNREVTAILEETETVLLRSARNDEKRAEHYQRIAAAVGSNKVLLRSSELRIDPGNQRVI